MAKRGLVRAGFCLFILLAMCIVAGGAVASQVGQGQLDQAHRPFPVNSAQAGHAPHSSHPIADDGLTHLSPEFQTLEVVPRSVFLLTFTLLTVPRSKKDLLSLTQRRRE